MIMNNVNSLMQKFTTKKAVVSIMGLGYVGLPLAVLFAESGMSVIGYEINPTKAENINNGETDIIDVSKDRLKKVIEEGNFFATTDARELQKADAIIICVPTPLTSSYEPDVSYIKEAVNTIIENMSPNTLITLESTTYPGTSKELLLNPIEKCNFIVNENVFICYSPERVDPGNKNYKTENTPKVLGGIGELSTKVGMSLYESVINKVIPVSSTDVAEMSKLLENTFRSINIAFINEMSMLCNKMGINIWETIEASATKPFGFMPFTPGPGIGGHCIPLDPMYLSWKAKESNFFSRFIELSQEINHQMPEFITQEAGKMLNKEKKTINDSNILLIGMAYKEDINDLRESPSIQVFEQLTEQGGNVSFWDPLAVKFKSKNQQTYTTEEIDYNLLKEYDLVIILACHSIFDKNLLKENSKLILDTKDSLSLWKK